MRGRLFSLLLLLAVISTAATEVLWWQKAVIYQIYPRSYKDSNGDGIGDLNGITQSLEYVKETGIETIWLSPIFKSPMYDFGYDIADFRKIHPEYGTMEDFENLIKKAKSLDMRVLLDFVPNHSSNESDWFDLSANRTKGYENYFIWADGQADPNNPGKLLPPNNWVSVFRKSAWEYNSVRGQFYLHQFAIAQPDLNYRDPLLVKEMKDIVRFWLDKGISGFRVDAVPFLFEVDPKDFGGKFPDEPRSNILNVNKDDYGYLDHIYTTSQNPTYGMIYEWRAILDEYEKKDGLPRVMLVEAYADIKNVMRYYGDGIRDGAHLPFNFEFMGNINNGSDARDMKFMINKWLTYMPFGRTANWVNGNHDTSRVATRLGLNKADAINMIGLLLPGATLTYQGEELAMTDGEVTWEETKDPQACNTDDPINFWKSSRDPERTPFHWDDSNLAGFTTGKSTWLPVAKNYKEVNVKAQKAASRSHYKFYKDLVALKKQKVVVEGKLVVEAPFENILIIQRNLGNEMVVGVVNLENRQHEINLSLSISAPSEMVVYASSIAAKLEKGNRVTTTKMTLSPYDAIVLTTMNVSAIHA